MSLDDPVGGDLAATLSGQTTLVRELDAATQRMGRTIASAFARGVVEGRRFEDVLRSVALRLSQGLLSQSLTPLATGLSGLLTQGFGALIGGLAGGATGRVIPFAQGGVVAAPTFFGFGDGELGVMGERGAEAILPLRRGPDGRLGVSAGGMAGHAARPISVSVTISTPDVAGFRRSEAEVSAAIARAVARGRRAL